jgi:hypothetical protein
VQLTDEQAETARAEGCRFVPATEAQVRQFSMQRRVFTIDGAPYLAARQDGFYETAGTLMALIGEALRRRDALVPAAPKEAAPEPVVEDVPAPEVPVAEVADEPDVEDEDEEAAEDEEVIEEPLPRAAVQAPVMQAPLHPAAPVMAATVTIVKGYARRAPMDPAQLTALVSTVHGALQRLR